MCNQFWHVFSTFTIKLQMMVKNMTIRSKGNNYLFHEFCVYTIIIITSTNIVSSFKLKYIDLKKKNMDCLYQFLISGNFW